MVSPFDIAWAVLKSHDDDEFPPAPDWASTSQGYDPDRTQDRYGNITHHPEPEYPPEEAPEEMEPSLEESQAMAPDVDAEEVLSRLSPEEAEALRNHFSGGGQ